MPQSETNGDASGAGPSEMECIDEYDDTEVSATFCSIAFSAYATPGRDLSQFWAVDSACSINLAAFRSKFVSFDPPSGTSRVGVWVLMCVGAATLRLPSHLYPGRSHVAKFTRGIPVTCRHAMHSALAAFLVSARCNPTSAVKSFFLVTRMLDCCWYPKEWVC
jgi:hypothetical protein